MPASSQSGPNPSVPVPGRPSGATSPLVAGLDVGTTAVKGVLVDEDGLVVERCRLASGVVVGAGGRFQHDARATWWEAPPAALGRLLGGPAGGRLQAVAVSAMMPSVAAVDASGRPVGPGLLYGDPRGRDPDEQGEAGADPTASYEMARLSGWAAADAPGAAGLWPAQAVANAALGGPGTIDLASAFASGPLFGGSGWDPAICDSHGFGPEQLPRVAMFGEAIGHVAPGAWRGEPGGESSGRPGGESSGGPGGAHPGDVVLGAGAGAVVLGAGAVDGLCEQLVAGAVNDGDVLVALGSTLVVWLCVPGWPDEVPGLWRVPHIAAGKAMVGGASNAGGMWVDWVDRALRPGNAGPEVDQPPGDVPLWWPWARGERVPWHDPSLTITLGHAQLSQGPLALRRAALEASAFVARHIISLAAAGTGTRPRRFIPSGGGTANGAWVQALADVLGEAVTPMATPEGAALGAAFLARMAAGLETSTDDAVRWARWSAPIEPRPDWAEAAGERYQRWCQYLPVAPGPIAPGPSVSDGPGDG